MIKKENYTLYLGSMLDVLDTLPENSIDSVVTDPPYEIGFMNKGWDNSGIAFRVETWKKVLRVLKPGGHLLAFNHSRTFHRMAVAIEDSGFQIRDTIMWMYGSGFPKSHNISIGIDKKFGAEREVVGTKTASPKGISNAETRSDTAAGSYGGEKKEIPITTPSTDEARQWDGWGTALKPSYEPIIMARKPLDGTIADNVLKHGVGGINIDKCRVGTEERFNTPAVAKENTFNCSYDNDYQGQTVNGRFPANTIHDGSEEVTEGFPETTSSGDPNRFQKSSGGSFSKEYNNQVATSPGDSGSASRFFYTAKASKKDRDEGLDGFDYQISSDRNKIEGVGANNPRNRTGTPKKNIHPTVKPTNLMQYLIRLVTPKGGKVLDPFMGSGSTGKAAMIENNERNAGYHFIGIDLSQEYIDIAESRIEYGIKYRENKAKEEEIEKRIIDKAQVSFEI